ncbi:predicted protein [Brucella abortus bv. 4 str. 292]|uniref:Uncharacterized protein n=10 Tax=Brucella TaxID=234 RepID=Q2YN98_BRUA2|nr:hypothetical protein BR0761 [Brucella suis 1330]AAX74146.1 hypothetical protein BruAb1_0778 [Brucella abortus bv. 1 str. 9-941]ABQ60294.1 hypothetical protein BOV_0756 [Brucella ovis ATCC 25840]ABX61846.1 Hypothetical protein, conserved [Brucella canis ATCC 23365]ABY37867.1 Hypothetical protein, conserved [Brucella suis ATCC 23445]ACD72257.1 hypothetical protein BAbS19_I07330 [Brucella abortus S19]ACO00557.1 Hypothetical protein, conserved [Brucella melitensis ATCC 23457]ACU47753.1 hypoth
MRFQGPVSEGGTFLPVPLQNAYLGFYGLIMSPGPVFKPGAPRLEDQ